MLHDGILLYLIRLQSLAFYPLGSVNEEREKHDTSYTRIQDELALTIHFFHTFVFKLCDKRTRLSCFYKGVFEHPLSSFRVRSYPAPGGGRDFKEFEDFC